MNLCIGASPVYVESLEGDRSRHAAASAKVWLSLRLFSAGSDAAAKDGGIPGGSGS
jgi:hypothetical protein